MFVLILLLASAPPCAAQSEKSDSESAAILMQRAALVSDLRALEADAKDLLKPLDAAAAKAEIAAAAWTLDREWAKGLLRDALELSFPDKVDRLKTRARKMGDPLQPPTPEDMARGIVRSRIMSVASPDREFSLELAGVTARELGGEQEVMQYTRLAADAVREGQLEEAGGYIMKGADADPTFINTGIAITGMAERDRAAADRLLVQYIARLRALPPASFAVGGGLIRTTLALRSALLPDRFNYFRGAGAPTAPPAGREAFRAYFSFVFDLYTALEREKPGSTFPGAQMELTTMWKELARHAPEMLGPFQQLEAASRRPGTPPPSLPPPDPEDSSRRRHEEQVRLALKTKDQANLDFLVGRSLSRKEFDDARKLVDIMEDRDRRARLAEEVDCAEAVALAAAGDTAHAEKLARQLTSPNTILRAFPPLVRRLAAVKETSSASLLALEGVRRLAQSAESGAGDQTYIPAPLAQVAGSIRLFKQSRALLAMSELTLAVLPADGQTAFDALDELVRVANKAPITSESGNPNFNPEVFARLARADSGRARAAASRLEDRLQRIAAAASVLRAEAQSLDERAKALKPAAEQNPKP